jgi:hypothetical protein
VDRAPWPETKDDIRYYNTDLVKAVEKDETEVNVTGILPGPSLLGDDVEAWVDKLHGLSGERGFPREVLLTGSHSCFNICTAFSFGHTPLGPRGCGKSSILNQAVLHARSRGWLCFFVPNGWHYVQSGDYIIPAFSKPDGTIIYDNPQQSAQILRGFYKAHSSVLRSISIRDPVSMMEKYKDELATFEKEWARLSQLADRENLPFVKMRELVDEDNVHPEQDALDKEVLQDFNFKGFKLETLADLCLLGVAFRNFAGVCAVDLIGELKELESVPVMFAVDHWNFWEVKSAFAYEDVAVVGKQMCIPDALQFLSHRREVADKWKMKNGLCIAALSNKHMQANGQKITYEGKESSIPVTIRVPHYDSTEFASACAMYQSVGNLNRSVTTQELMGFRTMCGSLPEKFRTDLPMYWCMIEVTTSK